MYKYCTKSVRAHDTVKMSHRHLYFDILTNFCLCFDISSHLTSNNFSLIPPLIYSAILHIDPLTLAEGHEARVGSQNEACRDSRVLTAAKPVAGRALKLHRKSLASIRLSASAPIRPKRARGRKRHAQKSRGSQRDPECRIFSLFDQSALLLPSRLFQFYSSACLRSLREAKVPLMYFGGCLHLKGPVCRVWNEMEQEIHVFS